MALIIPWGAIAVGVPVGVTMGGYMLYGAYTWGQVSYRVEQLEKQQAAAAIEALKTELKTEIMSDEFTIKTHESRLNWMDKYLQSHPWTATVTTSKAAVADGLVPSPGGQ